MFAVRGWAVPSTALKTQTNKTNEDLTDTIAEEASANSDTSRKRKRNGSGAATQLELLPSKDLSDLWQQHVERKPKAEASVGKHSTKEPTISKAAQSGPQKHLNNGEAPKRPESQSTSSKAERASKDKPKASSPPAGAHSNEVALSGETEKRGEQASLKKSKKERKKEKKQSTSSGADVKESKLTTLQSTMRDKLISSRFRHLNETLYTKPSEASMTLFQANPQFFTEYHDGFRRQVDAWPENPRDTFLRWIRVRGALDVDQSGGKSRILWKQRKQMQQHHRHHDPSAAGRPEQELLPRHPHNGHCTIADLGCGEGQLGRALIESPPRPTLTKRLQLYVHSFDLASTSPHVTACDIRALPLGDESVDVAIFCLALMGTNWIEFVEEAYRVLRWRGEVWISEVGSRFANPARAPEKVVEHSVGKRRKTSKQNTKKGEKALLPDAMPISVDEEDAPPQPTTDVTGFVDVLHRRGFQLMGAAEMGDKAMFVRMRFIKCLPPSKGKCVASSARNTPGARLAFIDEKPRQEISTETEGAVLKPCVYKLR